MWPVFSGRWLLLIFLLCSCVVLPGGADDLGRDVSPGDIRRAVAELGASPSLKDRLRAAELTQMFPLYLGGERLLKALKRQMYDANAEVRRFAFATIKDMGYAASSAEPVSARVDFVNRLEKVLVAYLERDGGDALRAEAESALAVVRESPYYLRR